MATRRIRETSRSTDPSSRRGRSTSARKPSQGQKTASRSSSTRVAERKARKGSHAVASTHRSNSSSKTAPKRNQPSAGLGARRSHASNSSRFTASKQHSAKQSGQSNFGQSAATLVKERALANKPLTIVLAIIALIVVIVVWDSASNMGKAYGNVSINGMSVAGMTEDDMRNALDEKFGSKLSSSSVTVYASEDARQREGEKFKKETDEATAEQISVEDAQAKVTSWTADGSTLGATLPYDQVIAEALEAGRRGGPFGRIALAVAGEDIPLTVQFDAKALDSFAEEVDKTVGDKRVDATVAIEGGVARSVPGHDGYMVDRDWLSDKLSNVMLEKDGSTYVIAEAVEAPSRTSEEQAKELCESINKALQGGAAFTYKSTNWSADATELGNWTKVAVVEKDGGYALEPSVDSAIATSALVKHLSGAKSTSDTENIVVDFESSDSGVMVKTSGSAEIPEVGPAIEQVNDGLYGPSGTAWAQGAGNPVKIDIGESNAPETLSFDQAVELGIITVIGEYTTEFSNEEGTENRNHNIKLVCDIINDSVCESGGGQWAFNEHTGDTNLDPPFASAGSIVNGEYVDSIGGGICQVATTVFNAVFEAGLDVVQRRNHSLYIGSYPTGRDVGVSYPELDFVWENKLASDVLLKMSYTDTSVTAKLYSVYTGYKVESTVGEWEEGSKYRTEFEEDSSLGKGESYLKTVGEDGSKISVTRTVTDKNGKLVSDTVFDSVYEPKNEVYLIGPGTDTSDLQRAAQNRMSEPESSVGSEPVYEEVYEESIEPAQIDTAYAGSENAEVAA